MLRILGLVSLVALSSCGSDKGKKDVRPAERTGTGETTGFDLQGMGGSTWLSNCLPSDSSDTSATISYQIEDERMARTLKVFNGLTCAASELYAIKVGTYNETRISNTDEVAGGKLVKSIYGSKTFAPESDAFTATLNETKVYGFTDWLAKTPRDVSGLKYDAESKAEWKAGKRVELIYKVADEKLFFAYFDDNNAPYFDENIFATKQ